MRAAKARANRHRVPVGDEEVNGLVRVRKRAGLPNQEVAQLFTAANLGLAKCAAVANKIRRNQRLEALPVLPVDCLDKLSNDGLVVFNAWTTA
jgi:hypothetical protein